MKTKQWMGAAITVLFVATPFFGAMADTAVKPHKVVLKNIVFDSLDATTKTITAHSGSTNYTINASRAKIRRGSGEKTTLSGFLEFFQDDSLTVWGTTTDGTNITASKVKNNSTRKIKGLYLATVVYISSADTDYPAGMLGEIITLKNGSRLAEVVIYNNTKFWFGKRKIAYADLQAGDVASIQGIVRTYDDFDIIHGTTKVKVRNHGAVPNFTPNVLKTQILKK
jgi:hypothetical protein